MNSFDRERLRIQRTKMLYPPGTRIVLDEMGDPYAPVSSSTIWEPSIPSGITEERSV